MANRIILNETSYFGKGAIQEIPNEIKARGCKKVMVCTDPDLLKFQVATKVTDLLDAASIDYAVYDGIKATPPLKTFRRALLSARMRARTSSWPSAAAARLTPARRLALS